MKSFMEKYSKCLCDNEAVIKLSRNSELHSRAKHISLKEFFIRDLVTDGEASVSYIDSASNPADILTNIDESFCSHLSQLTLDNDLDRHQVKRQRRDEDESSVEGECWNSTLESYYI
jgi:hypothetical protein